MKRHRVVIVGGGFAGLAAAKGLARAPVDVTLVVRRNYHLFQPLLYQVATGGLSPADISAPIRAILHRQSNVRVVMDEAVGVDVPARKIQLRDHVLEYDTLIVATGGLAAVVGPHCETVDRIEPALTITGLAIADRYLFG